MLTLANVRGQIKAARYLLRPFNLALEQVIRDADVNAGRTILFNSTQLLAYADDIDIIGEQPEM